MAEPPVVRDCFQSVANGMTKVQYTPRTMITTGNVFTFIPGDD
jgi:hypothetical protein